MDNSTLPGSSKAAKPEPTRPFHILSMNNVDRRKFLRSFDHVIMGCEGVLWYYVEPILGAGPGVMLLKEAGKTIKFISNNTLLDDNEMIRQLGLIGITGVESSDLYFPMSLMVKFLKRNYDGKTIFSMCCPEINDRLKKSGVIVASIEPMINLEPKALSELFSTDMTHNVAAVLIDTNYNLTYSQLVRGYQHLLKPDCVLLVGSSDPFLPISRRLNALGPGGFVKLLNDSTGKDPIVLGKNGKWMQETLRTKMNIMDKKRVLYIGSNLTTDMAFATKCGFNTLFVLSGESNLDQMEQIAENLRPNYLADSVKNFKEFFDRVNKKKPGANS